MTLRLEIAEFKDADHWRWRLTDAGGAFLADHAVALDQNEPQYQALSISRPTSGSFPPRISATKMSGAS